MAALYPAAVKEVLCDDPGICSPPPPPPPGTSNFWFTCVTVDSALSGFTIHEFWLYPEAAITETRPTWQPMHVQSICADAQRRIDGTSERAFLPGRCLPSKSGIHDSDLERVVVVIQEFACGRAQ